MRETRQRRVGVLRQPPLALDRFGELHQPQIELGDALLGAGLLAVQRVAGEIEPL